MLIPALGLGAREEGRHRHSIKGVTAVEVWRRSHFRRAAIRSVVVHLPVHAIGGEIYSRSHDAAIRV